MIIAGKGTGMITGVNHITLSVSSVERSFVFYADVLGFTPLARWPKGVYFTAGSLWLCIELDPNVRREPLPERSHVAFAVAPENFGQLSARIRAAGAVIWQENWTEGDSLYFLDPDGHKLEIHASDLKTRLQAAKAKPWEGVEFLV
jgi:catechol 2,3-dioxygenase-like lactoylglutathione lyase family enzyme